MRLPRSSCFCVAVSRSVPSCANASSSRKEARSRRKRAGELLHRLALGVAADARHRDADVHGRPDAGEEEVGLEVDLAVGDRDHVGRDVGRDLAFERLDDRQRRQRAARVREAVHPVLVLVRQRREEGLGVVLAVRAMVEADLVVGPHLDRGGEPLRVLDHLGAIGEVRRRVLRHHAVLVAQLRRALEQAGVEVEDVAGVGLAARRAAQEQRQLAVRRRLLRKVVVDARAWRVPSCT